jgi:hypothetical protein
MNSNDYNTNFLIDMRNDLEREIITLKNILLKKNEQLEYITKFVRNNCIHEWEFDNIDLHPETQEGLEIKFCKHCLLTDNTR